MGGSRNRFFAANRRGLYIEKAPFAKRVLNVLLYKQSILSLSGRFGFLFAANAGLLIVLSLADLLLNAILDTASLESAERVVQCFVFFDSNKSHFYLPSLQLWIVQPVGSISHGDYYSKLFSAVKKNPVKRQAERNSDAVIFYIMLMRDEKKTCIF